MKANMLRNMMIVVLLALASAMQATAVNYRNSYRGVQRSYSNQPSIIKVQTVGTQTIGTQTATPSATFQSTSAYSDQWNQNAQQSTLNSDGTVNAEAYGVGRPSVGVKRGTNPGTPTDEEEEEEEQQPLGDGLFVLLLMAGAYAGVRMRKRAIN